MRLDLAARVRGAFRADPETAELVTFGNAFTAVGVGLCALLRWELSPAATGLVVAAAFLLLCVCLLFRPTIWIAALVGSAAAAVGPALVLASLGFRLHRLAGWAGAVAGITVGLRFAYRSYFKFGTARESRAPHDA
jgi:hypothetical protein